MLEFVRVATVKEVPPGRMQCVEAGGREIALCNVGGTVHAIGNLCPHQGGPLAEGSLDDGIVTCPWHGWTFQAADGMSPFNSGAKVPSYPVRQDGEDLLVQVD